MDPDSTLHRDLMQLKGQEGTDHVLLNMTFTVSEVIHLKKKTDAGVSIISIKAKVCIKIFGFLSSINFPQNYSTSVSMAINYRYSN